MTHDDNNHNYAMTIALMSMEDDVLHVANALRDMAEKHPSYQGLNATPSARNIWRAAANFLEKTYKTPMTSIKIGIVVFNGFCSFLNPAFYGRKKGHEGRNTFLRPFFTIFAGSSRHAPQSNKRY